MHPILRSAWAVALVATLWTALPGRAELAAQTMDPRPPATNLTWWHPLAAAGGVGALFLVDVGIRDWVQDHKGSTADDVADFAKDFKDPKVIAVSSLGATALGLVLSEPKVTVTGLQIAAAYGVAGGLNYVTKWTFGRTRPSGTPDDATNFDFFSGDEDSAFPSGSAAVVFSLATTLADAIDRTPVSIALYSGAALNAWARMYSDRHWLSDVTLGALVGITSAKLVNGEWTVFGLRPPQLWTDGRTLGMRVPLGRSF